MTLQHSKQFERWNSDLTRFVQTWRPEDCKAAVLIVHGLGEHSGRYAGLAQWFAERGYLARVFDQQGHGRDQRKRGCVDSYDALLEEIEHFLAWSKGEEPDLPHLLMGHSMGGNLVINTALRKSVDVQGVISSSPMLRSKRKIAKWYEMVARALLLVAPNFQLQSEIIVERLTDLEQEQQALREDELFHSCLSLRLGAGLIDSGRWAIENAGQLQVPLLLVHGTDDYLTCPDASEDFASNAGELCEFSLLDGMLHDTFRCKDQQRAKKLFLDFLNRYSRQTGGTSDDN